MNRNKKIPGKVLIMICGMLILLSCKKQIQPTTLEIKDPDRHYYPILQGQELDLVFQVTNTGKNPLVIQDIQPSCGCIVEKGKFRNIIPPEGKENIALTYNSTKNIGLVAHSIRIYGNIADSGMIEIKFDVNVVPNADYTRDYEQLFKELNIKNGAVKKFVDGEEAELGYYVGEP